MEIMGQAEAEGINLFFLVKHHKENCDGECNVSLSMIRPIYEEIMGREITEEEQQYFI